MNRYWIVLAALLPLAVSATGYRQDDCNGIKNCNDIEIDDHSIDNDSRSNSDADARSYSDSDADSRSYSDSDSRSGVYGSGNSHNYTEGGDARAHQGQGQSQGQETDASSRNKNRNSNETDVTVEGDTSYQTEYEYESNYSDDDVSTKIASDDDVTIEGDTDNSTVIVEDAEVSAQAATLLAAICQDGTSVQGVKFGLSVVKQSQFCMYVTAAQLYVTQAQMLDCGARESIAKGGTPIPSPQPTSCERTKRALWLKATGMVDKAVAIADSKSKKGLGRAILGLLW